MTKLLCNKNTVALHNLLEFINSLWPSDSMHGVVWRGVEWCGAARHGAVRYGMVLWCSVVWCGVDVDVDVGVVWCGGLTKPPETTTNHPCAWSHVPCFTVVSFGGSVHVDFTNTPQSYVTGTGFYSWQSRIILGMGSANERRRYTATPSLIGWAHAQNDPLPIIHFSISSLYNKWHLHRILNILRDRWLKDVWNHHTLLKAYTYHSNLCQESFHLLQRQFKPILTHQQQGSAPFTSDNSIRDTQESNYYNAIKNYIYIYKIKATSPMGQWGRTYGIYNISQ